MTSEKQEQFGSYCDYLVSSNIRQFFPDQITLVFHMSSAIFMAWDRLY